MSPLLVRILRFLVIGLGAMLVVSAVVNIIATYSLIGPLEEDSLNLTRGQIVSWYIGPAVLGLALILGGFFWRRRRR